MADLQGIFDKCKLAYKVTCTDISVMGDWGLANVWTMGKRKDLIRSFFVRTLILFFNSLCCKSRSRIMI